MLKKIHLREAEMHVVLGRQEPSLCGDHSCGAVLQLGSLGRLRLAGKGLAGKSISLGQFYPLWLWCSHSTPCPGAGGVCVAVAACVG